MFERDVQIKSNDVTLTGTLTVPDEGQRYPGVLFIAGSGQVDRNENHKKLPINAFREMAHFLANNGIASLRYDKRGVGQSTGDFWSTGFNDNAQDALSALEFLKKQDMVQPEQVFALGHSEGAFIATRLAGSGAQLAGVILIAGAAQSGEAVLKWQALEVARGLKGFNGWLIKVLHIDVARSQQKQLDKIKKSKKDWYRQQLVAKINVKWMREFLAYNPADDLAKITAPVLAITGSKDIQVDPKDLERMASLVKSPFEYHVIPNMTHLLRKQEGEAGISTYKEQVKRPTDQGMMEIILKWLTARVQAKK